MGQSPIGINYCYGICPGDNIEPPLLSEEGGSELGFQSHLGHYAVGILTATAKTSDSSNPHTLTLGMVYLSVEGCLFVDHMVGRYRSAH